MRIIKDNTIPRFASQDNEGRYVQTWIKTDGVYAQRYDVDGEPIGSKFQVSNIDIDEQGVEVDFRAPSSQAYAVSNSDGGLLVVWDCSVHGPYHHPDPDYRIYGQLYDSRGELTGGNFRIDEDRSL